MLDRLSIVYKYRVEGNKLQTPILLNGNFLAFSLFFRKYAYIGFNLGLTIMKIPDEIIKEIRESGYDQELVYTYIREILDSDKEYDV